MIKVTTKSKNPIILALKVFNKMLRLPFANKILNIFDADTFLSSQAGSSNVLRDFFLSSAYMSSRHLTIDISFLQNLISTFHGCFRVWLSESRLHTYPGLNCICTILFLSEGCHL
jgi:hypothetical protein